MSYKYAPVSTADHSQSFFSGQEISASKDLTDYIFGLAHKSRNLSNVRSFSRPSDFLTYSQQLEKEIQKTSKTLSKLKELNNRSTLFNNDDSKINDLIVDVKQEITDIQKKIIYLQNNNDLIYSKQSEKMSRHILEILNLRFMEVTKDFKSLLEGRTQTIKQFKEKESFLSMAGSKVSEVRSRRNNKTEAAFLKRGKGAIDLEDSAGGYSNGQAEAIEIMQVDNNVEHLKKRQESVKSIQKTLEEVMGIFTRISSMVQMQEIMIERIDKDTEDSLRNVESGKKNLVKYYKNISSTRRMIISVMIFLMFFATIYILII